MPDTASRRGSTRRRGPPCHTSDRSSTLPDGRGCSWDTGTCCLGRRGLGLAAAGSRCRTPAQAGRWHILARRGSSGPPAPAGRTDCTAATRSGRRGHMVRTTAGRRSDHGPDDCRVYTPSRPGVPAGIRGRPGRSGSNGRLGPSDRSVDTAASSSGPADRMVGKLGDRRRAAKVGAGSARTRRRPADAARRPRSGDPSCSNEPQRLSGRRRCTPAPPPARCWRRSCIRAARRPTAAPGGRTLGRRGRPAHTRHNRRRQGPNGTGGPPGRFARTAHMPPPVVEGTRRLDRPRRRRAAVFVAEPVECSGGRSTPRGAGGRADRSGSRRAASPSPARLVDTTGTAGGAPSSTRPPPAPRRASH